MDIVVNDHRFSEFISEKEIEKMVANIADQITKDHSDTRPLFIGILNGAFIFVADLIRQIGFPCEIHFVKLKSYDGMNTSGNIQEEWSANMDVEGRSVILIEDIVDTGNTLFYYLKKLKCQKPKSLQIASLLLKPKALQKPICIDYLGREIPNDFVIGYGLDYDYAGRDLKSIYKLNSK